MGLPTTDATGRLGETDVRYLRDLAARVAEIGAHPVQEQKAGMWRRHNDLERVRPMVLAFPEGAWRELMPADQFRIAEPAYRGIEWDLKARIYSWEHMPDDNVIEPVVATPIVTRRTGWGLDEQRTRPDDALGAFHIDPVIHDESDLDKLTVPRLTVDWEETERREARLRDLVGDILSVQRRGIAGGGYAPLDHYARLRGIDNVFLDLVDNPGMVHRAVSFFTDGEIQVMRDAEAQGAITIVNRNNYAGSGGTCYTRQLPAAGFDGTHARARDVWGFATAQIFSEVSPAMHEEFALAHEKRFLDLFGLNCYGCCEPLHRKLDSIIATLPRLRRISISPWADVATSAEKLADRYVFSWKPNPAVLAAETFQPEAIRADLVAFCERTRGNVVEIIMKDTHTIRNDPRRMHEWVRIAREVAEEYA